MDEKLPEWKTSYEVGIPEVDHQHRCFFEMIHTLGRRIDEGLDKEATASNLKEIIYYTNFHFLSESNRQCFADWGVPKFNRNSRL